MNNSNLRLINDINMINNNQEQTSSHISPIQNICNAIQNKQASATTEQVFLAFDSSHQSLSNQVTIEPSDYHDCLYQIAKTNRPQKILQIGLPFDVSALALLKACPKVELFVALSFPTDNTPPADNTLNQIPEWLNNNDIPLENVRCFQARPSFNNGEPNHHQGEMPYWHQMPELLRILQANDFDILFINGTYAKDELVNELNLFWHYLKPGGLLICDALLDPVLHKNIVPSDNPTWSSFHSFLTQKASSISDYYIWNYPTVPYQGIKRSCPLGLIIKEKHTFTVLHSGFKWFDMIGAININRARLDHLASLGLDIAHSTVLEVAAGVGWHSGFFERLGCKILSTDARVENVEEIRRRYPYRQVAVADLSVPNSHTQFGNFDIVYCYGALYHLSNPELCISDLAKVCKRYLFLETCVSLTDNGKVNSQGENRNFDHSFEGIGCRPARDYVWSLLNKYFPYVYISTVQPNHSDFPLQWPIPAEPKVGNARGIFVAAKTPIECRYLSPVLINTFERLHDLGSILSHYKYYETEAWIKNKSLQTEELIEKGDYSGAKILLNEILQKDNTNIIALHYLAIINIIIGDIDNSINTLRILSETNSSDERPTSKLKISFRDSTP